MEINIGVYLICCFLCFIAGYAGGREDGIKRGIEIVKAAQQKMHPTLGESAASDSESKPAPKRVI